MIIQKENYTGLPNRVQSGLGTKGRCISQDLSLSVRKLCSILKTLKGLGKN